MIAVHLTL